jgi:deaminated glutathione amidase
MASGILRIATCQFAVGADIRRNAEQIRGFLSDAAGEGAELVHVPECALCGYAGIDWPTLKDFDWGLLVGETQTIMELAGRLKIWVALGSMHRLTEPNPPHNCLYLISPDGRIVNRYDKRFGTPMDQQHYTPGDRFVTFTINGVTCSLLICFDLRFPELYRRLYGLGVQCVLQSFYNARQNGPSVHSEIMRQTMQAHAATNHFWISMANASGWFSPYPSCFIQPDGRIVRQLEDHRDQMMINTVDLSQSFYDPMAEFRNLALEGKLTNGPGPLGDPRSIRTDSI